MILPAALKAGDTVAALSLSWGGPGALPGRYPAGKAQLEREYGVTVVELPLTLQKPAYVAAHPELRAADLHAALRDPAIAGIVSTIGGDDSIRMLPYLDLDLIARSVRNLAGEHRRLDRRALSVGEPAPADAGAQAGPVDRSRMACWCSDRRRASPKTGGTAPVVANRMGALARQAQ